MDEMWAAAFWFWIPLMLIPIGLYGYLRDSNRKSGLTLTIFALLMVMASPWTVPSSDSTAGGHLLLTILGPSALMAYGLYGMVFGGNVPVGRLDASARWSGAIATVVAIVLMAMMHWGNFTPIWRGDVNPYWIVFWPTFLLFSTSLCALASLALVGFGSERLRESLNLAGISVAMAGVALAAMLFDGSNTSAEEFRGHLWLAAADILGTLAGVGASIATFAIVIWSYESNLPTPSTTTPPTEDEVKHVVAIAKSHIGGEEE